VNTPATSGLHYQETTVSDPSDPSTDVKVMFWEYGSDQYQFMAHRLFELASCVLICYDLGDFESFESLTKNQCWIKEATLRAPRCPIMLVGCKSDCVVERVVEVRMHSRQTMQIDLMDEMACRTCTSHQ
jgi:GTPase SAR1 family protein